MGDPVQASQDATPLPQRIGRYRILCELGTGSMATLYLARMTGLGRFERLFAVKITHENLSKERSFVEMFMNEARIAAKIQHPNVIPVYEIDVERGRYYMVMDYVSGETLALVLKNTWNKERPFPVAYAAQVVAAACEGLHAAHELRGTEGPLGVVHRDVAPQNLMIGYDGIVRVMDFGIAKALDTISMTMPGMMKGTIAYMAPEQVRCQPIDRRVDVFALGTILWESTVGMRLFRHKNDVTTAARVVKMQIPPPSTLRKGYPIELERIVMKAVQRDKEQRYQTAREMGEDLAEFLHKTQERVTPAVIGAFMTSVFPEQLRQRQEMEQKAREIEPPSDLTYTPADISADSLVVVNADAEVELDDLEGPNPFQRPPSAPTASLTVPKTAKLDRASQKGVPTLIVRARGLDEKDDDAPPETQRKEAPAAKEPEPPTKDVEPATKDVEPPTKELDAKINEFEPPTKELPRSTEPAPATEVRPQLESDIDSAFERAFGIGAVPQIEEERATLALPVEELEDLGRKKRPLVAAVTAGAVLLLIGVLVVAGQKDSEEAEEKPEPKLERVMARMEPQTPAKETPTIEIRFAVKPKTAEISVDGARQVGPLKVPQSKDRLVIRASAEGFQSDEKIISAESNQTVEFDLVPEPEDPAIEKPKPKKKAKPPKKKRSTTKEPKPRAKKGSSPKLLFQGDDL